MRHGAISPNLRDHSNKEKAGRSPLDLSFIGVTRTAQDSLRFDVALLDGIRPTRGFFLGECP